MCGPEFAAPALFVRRKMSKGKSSRWIRLAIILLAVALVVIVAVIIWKQFEYRASETFYESLRGAL